MSNDATGSGTQLERATRARTFPVGIFRADMHVLEIKEHRAEQIKDAAISLEEAVAEFLDAYTAFNNDELDEVSVNDAEHDLKLSMYALRETRK